MCAQHASVVSEFVTKRRFCAVEDGNAVRRVERLAGDTLHIHHTVHSEQNVVKYVAVRNLFLLMLQVQTFFYLIFFLLF